MSGVLLENGHPAGNHYDKYNAQNALARLMMRGFLASVISFAKQSGTSTVHEIGCGEGHLATALFKAGFTVRGSDVSSEIIEMARNNAAANGLDIGFKTAEISQLTLAEDAAPLVVCCEVLEHLEDPNAAIEMLADLASPYLIVSVPREPLWRCLNLCRGSYVADFGNTPGHLQHWSRTAFLRFLPRSLEVLAVASPIPWTIVLCKRRN